MTQDTRTPSIPRKMSFRDTLSVSGRKPKRLMQVRNMTDTITISQLFVD